MFTWLYSNKEWLFSGVGVALFAALVTFGKRLYSDKSHRPTPRTTLVCTIALLLFLAGYGFYSGWLTTPRPFAWLHLAGSVALALSLSGWTAYAVAKSRVEKLAIELSTVKMHDTFRDHVTQALNTNAVAHTFVECFSIARNQQRNFSALLIDLDHFKRINEIHDIKGGDRCLRQIAILLTKTLRGESDKLMRYRHGDEFLILLPETSGDNAEFVAKRIIGLIENTPLPIEEDVLEHLTASLSFTEVNLATDNLETVSGRLEKGLKKAKLKQNTYVRA